jgi:hypothetical protein
MFKSYFAKEKMVRDLLVSFILFLGGLVLLVCFFILATIPNKGGDLYYLLQNIGIFFLFVSLFILYATIHRGNIVPGDHTVKSLLLNAAKSVHIIAGILLGTFLAIFITALVELIFSLFGYIPYAGPVIMGLLSLPLFVINFVVITFAVLVWVIAPPMIGEGVNFKQMPFDFIALARRRGLIIIGYTVITLVALIVLFGPVLMIIRYATGITRAVQWNIAPAYPQIFKSIMRPSYITDIIGQITPHTDPIAALQQYGTSIFNYVEMLGVFLKFIYGVAISALVSVFLAIFFNTLSFFYTWSKKSVLK